MTSTQPRAAADPQPAPVAPDPAGQPVRARRLGPRSLTSRLITAVVTLVVLLVLAIGASTYFALRSFLYDRLDQQVQSTADSPIDRLFRGEPVLNPGVRAPQSVWAVALDGTGGVLAEPLSAGIAESMDLSPAQRRSLVARTSQAPVTVTTRDGVRLRVTTRAVRATSVQTGRTVQATAVIGLSTDEADRTLHRLVGLELIVGATAVLVAFLATTYGVRRSLRRLRSVTRTAQEVTAELSPTGAGLQRRVPVSGVEADTEVGQLAESINTLLAAVETQFAARVASEERMRQFLADASHELRTPLTSIRGYAELARMQREKEGAAAQPSNLERIEFEGTRMSRLVDDLLTLARSDQAAVDGVAVEARPLDVARLLDDAVDGMRAAHPERTITVAAQPGLVVHGDQDALLRVVRNLVTNAAMHTAPGGPIEVRGFLDGHYVVVQVIDAGPGLPPEQAAHVFERFWRADKARTRAKGGSGLGLAIVAATVQSHGGLVRFDSTVEEGSTVTVWLPVGTA